MPRLSHHSEKQEDGLIKIEYDDGQPVKLSKGMQSQRSKFVTPRGRPRGFYAMFPDGTATKIEIGFMRVGEMPEVERLMNLSQVHETQTALSQGKPLQP